MGYNTKQKPMKKFDFSSLQSKMIDKPIEKKYMDDYREKIRELRQRLYQLMRRDYGTT